MADGTVRGVAYDFWARVKAAQASKGWSDVELKSRTGVARSTVNNLKTGKRPPARSTVNTLAEALDIDAEEARRLARVTPAEPTSRGDAVREAIKADPNYNEHQRQTMLAFVDLIEEQGTVGAEQDEVPGKGGRQVG